MPGLVLPFGQTVKLPVYRPQNSWTPFGTLTWNARNNRSTAWLYIDASAWLQDGAVEPDMLVGLSTAYSPVDGFISGVTASIIAGGQAVQLMPAMGASGLAIGTTYVLSFRLRSQQGKTEVFQINLPISQLATIANPQSGVATVQGDVITVGGNVLPVSGSS